MSSYSGKCDFGDTWEIWGEEKTLKAQVFFGQNIIPLRIDSYKDALPYFPYLESSSCYSDGQGYIHLTTRSFVDMEEEEHLTWRLDAIKKYARKCKRKKIEMDPNAKELEWYSKDDLFDKMFQLVKEKGDKAELDWSFHTSMAEYYREKLYTDMIKVGYSKFKAAQWVYGWDRFCYDKELAEKYNWFEKEVN